jgi:DNA-binding protein HU-beta
MDLVLVPDNYQAPVLVGRNSPPRGRSPSPPRQNALVVVGNNSRGPSPSRALVLAGGGRRGSVGSGNAGSIVVAGSSSSSSSNRGSNSSNNSIVVAAANKRNSFASSRKKSPGSVKKRAATPMKKMPSARKASSPMKKKSSAKKVSSPMKSSMKKGTSSSSLTPAMKKLSLQKSAQKTKSSMTMTSAMSMKALTAMKKLTVMKKLAKKTGKSLKSAGIGTTVMKNSNMKKKAPRTALKSKPSFGTGRGKKAIVVARPTLKNKKGGGIRGKKAQVKASVKKIARRILAERNLKAGGKKIGGARKVGGVGGKKGMAGKKVVIKGGMKKNASGSSLLKKNTASSVRSTKVGRVGNNLNNLQKSAMSSKNLKSGSSPRRNKNNDNDDDDFPILDGPYPNVMRLRMKPCVINKVEPLAVGEGPGKKGADKDDLIMDKLLDLVWSQWSLQEKNELVKLTTPRAIQTWLDNSGYDPQDGLRSVRQTLKNKKCHCFGEGLREG